jgi:hypothetical protein
LVGSKELQNLIFADSDNTTQIYGSYKVEEQQEADDWIELAKDTVQ